MSSLMQLQDVADTTRLGPLSAEVRAGEILHLVGPNGAGKSTLLARMAGLTTGSGHINFGGEALASGPRTGWRAIGHIWRSSRILLLQCRYGIF